MWKAIILVCVIAGVSAQPPTPVDSLVVRSYLGNYYQMYANQYALDRTQPNNSTCATIQYGLFNSTTLTVDNRYRQQSATGDLDRTTGLAATTAVTGVLTVNFDGIPGSFSYYVILLGPVVNNMYEYAAISDEAQSSLYVIARDPETFMANYDADVSTQLTALNFVGVSAPIATYQGSDCIYPKSFMPPTPVSTLDGAAYLGNWCQMYANKNTMDQSQPNGVCVTISYEELNATTWSVENIYYADTPSGDEVVTDGFAYLTAETGVVDVKFDNVPGMFSYIVTKTGPMENGMYSYAVVTDQNKFSMFLLVRDCVNFLDASTEAELLDYLEDDLGFDGLTNSPVKTLQNEQCKYPEGFISGTDGVTASIALLFAASVLRAFL